MNTYEIRQRFWRQLRSTTVSACRTLLAIESPQELAALRDACFATGDEAMRALVGDVLAAAARPGLPGLTPEPGDDAGPLSFESLCYEVDDWQTATFGRNGPESKIAHLRREVEELAARPYSAEEYADCFLLVIGAAMRAGIVPRALLGAVACKLDINRRRKWGKPQADGVVEHEGD